MTEIREIESMVALIAAWTEAQASETVDLTGFGEATKAEELASR
jgi:hypothetical protein